MPTQTYYSSDGVEGDFFDCVADAAAGESPDTHPTKWSRIDIPALFESFLVSRATALLQTGEGQSDKALAESKVAVTLLSELIYRDRNERGGRINRPKVFTR